MNEETDHWKPMSSNPIIPPNSVQDDIDLENEGEENGEGNGEENGDDIGEENLEVSLAPSNKPKRKPHIILDKPNKKPKSSTGIVIQQNMTKITESAQAFVAARFGGISIEEVMGHVIACGADLGSDEHFVATELFVKKEHRQMFMTIPTNEDRLNWLKRKFDMMFGK
jgi:hypothetical protein